MRNKQNRHKRINHMNSFISFRLQGKLRKCSEKKLTLKVGPETRDKTHRWDPGTEMRLGSQVSPIRWVPSLGSWVSPTVSGLGTHFSHMAFKRHHTETLFPFTLFVFMSRPNSYQTCIMSYLCDLFFISPSFS